MLGFESTIPRSFSFASIAQALSCLFRCAVCHRPLPALSRVSQDTCRQNCKRDGRQKPDSTAAAVKDVVASETSEPFQYYSAALGRTSQALSDRHDLLGITSLELCTSTYYRALYCSCRPCCSQCPQSYLSKARCTAMNGCTGSSLCYQSDRYLLKLLMYLAC